MRETGWRLSRAGSLEFRMIDSRSFGEARLFVDGTSALCACCNSVRINGLRVRESPGTVGVRPFCVVRIRQSMMWTTLRVLGSISAVRPSMTTY